MGYDNLIAYLYLVEDLGIGDVDHLDHTVWTLY